MVDSIHIHAVDYLAVIFYALLPHQGCRFMLEEHPTWLQYLPELLEVSEVGDLDYQRFSFIFILFLREESSRERYLDSYLQDNSGDMQYSASNPVNLRDFDIV